MALLSGERLWVLVNHFKSKYYGSQAANDAERKRKAKRVRELIDEHIALSSKFVAVVGELNEISDNEPKSALVGLGSPPTPSRNIPTTTIKGAGKRGNCTPTSKLE